MDVPDRSLTLLRPSARSVISMDRAPMRPVRAAFARMRYGKISCMKTPLAMKTQRKTVSTRGVTQWHYAKKMYLQNEPI